jgi:hypothetical protein
MKTKSLVLVLTLALVGMIFLAGGCKEEEPQNDATTVKTEVEKALCKKCGQVAGSDVCCKPGAVKCDKCGLVKDSPGCCKMPKI